MTVVKPGSRFNKQPNYKSVGAALLLRVLQMILWVPKRPCSFQFNKINSSFQLF